MKPTATLLTQSMITHASARTSAVLGTSVLGALALLAMLAACGGEPAPTSPHVPELPPDERPTATAPAADATAATTTSAAPSASAAPEPSATPVASAAPSVSAKPEPPKATGGLDVDDANLTIGSVTADGFTMRDLACKSDDAGGLGGLVLGPALVGILAKKKAQLRACAPKGGEARVRFVMEGGKVTSAEANAETPQIEACVVRTVKSSQAPLRGICAATFDLSR